MHGRAQPFHIGDDVSGDDVIAHLGVDQSLHGVSGDIKALGDGDESAAQAVQGEGDLRGDHHFKRFVREAQSCSQLARARKNYPLMAFALRPSSRVCTRLLMGRVRGWKLETNTVS